MKRALDLVAAVSLLVALAPALAVVGILVRIFNGSPVIFRQERPGQDGKPFSILKFRTMTDQLDGDGNALPDHERITRFGSFLRSSSLDELPELLNVARGEMSLVGPRPLLPRYMPFFSELELRRFEVRPGITGWAQINGRNNAAWDERLAMDTWYVENRTFGLDLKILAATVTQIIKRRDVVVDPTSVMMDLDAERARDGSRSDL